MKNLVLALGLAITPWGGQKTLPPTTTLSTPYIQQPQPERVIHQKNIITLVDALIIVESNGNPNAHCRKEKAVGYLQRTVGIVDYRRRCFTFGGIGIMKIQAMR